MNAQMQQMAKPSPGSSVIPVQAGQLQRKKSGEHEKDEDCPMCNKGLLKLQRKSANLTEPSPVPPVVHEVLNSPGQPLDNETRAFMEPRFGHDFSKVRVHATKPQMAVDNLVIGQPADSFEQEADKIEETVMQTQQPGTSPQFAALEKTDFSKVRVHTDARAAEAARAMNARAFTVGRDVIFGAGRYAPQNIEGKRLVAHELVHVVQQSSGSVPYQGLIQRLPSDGGSMAPLQPAPTPTLTAENPLVEAMSVFASIRASGVASGIYEGMYQGQSISLNQAKYDEMRVRVREAAISAVLRASNRAETAMGRYEEQQKVDAHHWIVAPIVKTLGRVTDPGPALVEYVQATRTGLTEARLALDGGDFVSAARLIGDAEGEAERASRMVLAYVDQVIGSAEMTVTVLEGVKTASEVVLFLCAVAATGGAAGAGATALGLEGAGATTSLLGVTGSTAAWATAIGTTAAITEEVAVGIVRAADGDKVDWGEVAVHAAIQVIVAKFSPSLGQRLTKGLGSVAVANPALRQMIARIGMSRVVTIATNLLMHEGSQFFATVVEDTVKALRGKPITWGEFGDHVFDRLFDPKGLFMATMAGALGGTHPEPSRQPGGVPPETTTPPAKSKSDTRDMRDINRELGLPKPQTKTKTPATPPVGTQTTTAEEAFRPTPAERTAAYGKELATKGPPLTEAGTTIQESAGASPKGQEFQSASMEKASAFPRTIRADVGESQAYQAALKAGEIGLERPQGTNVAGRADFVTAARDPSGEMWIIANDAKTRSSATSSFESPKPGLRPGWDAQVKAAVDRASLGNPIIEAELQAAYKAGRIWVRQVNVDLSAIGGGAMSGIAPPSPLPWGALLGPLDLSERKK